MGSKFDKIGRRFRTKRVDYDRILTLWRDGASDMEIARAVRCSEAAVAVWRKKNRLPRRLRPDERERATTN